MGPKPHTLAAQSLQDQLPVVGSGDGTGHVAPVDVGGDGASDHCRSLRRGVPPL